MKLSDAILVAVHDPNLHPEAMHIAAATGRPVVDADSSELSTAVRKASAVIVDAEASQALGEWPNRPRVFFAAFEPGPIDTAALMKCGAEASFVLPAQATELLRLLGRTDIKDQVPRGFATNIGVMGCVGGVGTSVLAAAIALRSPLKALLIDAAPNTGGLDLLLGIESERGLRWEDLRTESGNIDADDLWQALPRFGTNLAVLTGQRLGISSSQASLPDRIATVLSSVRDAQQLNVIDMPAASRDWDQVLQQLDALVLIVPAEVRGVAAARAIVDTLGSRSMETIVVLRHRNWSSVDAVDAGRLLGREVDLELENISRLSKHIELGGMPSPLPRELRRVADSVLVRCQ